MEEHIEMTVSACYNQSGMRRIKLLKRLRIALVICLFMAWTYGVSIAAALISEGSGVATRWMLEFVMFTIPATALLILVWAALSRLSRVFDYMLQEISWKYGTAKMKADAHWWRRSIASP